MFFEKVIEKQALISFYTEHGKLKSCRCQCILNLIAKHNQGNKLTKNFVLSFYNISNICCDNPKILEFFSKAFDIELTPKDFKCQFKE